MNEQIVVTENALGYLKGTSPWVKFLAVVGFVATAFMVLGGLFMFVGAALAPANSRLPAAFFPAVGVIYLVMSLFFCLIPSILLMRYGRAITDIPASGQKSMEHALQRQKTFWKYVGIFTVVWLVCYVLCIIGAIAFGFFSAAHLR